MNSIGSASTTSGAAATSTPGTWVKSADRTVALVEFVASAAAGATFSQIQRALDLPKSSLHALLATLTQREWLQVDATARYRIGQQLRTLVTPGNSADDLVIDAAMDLLEQARDDLGETVHLAALADTEILYLASRYSRQALGVRFHSGRRMPVYATGLGKAILSTLDPAAVARHLPATLVALTENTIVDAGLLAAELEKVREQRYAVDREEGTPGLCCVAVPFTVQGRRYGISCSKPSARWTPGEEVATAALLTRVARTVVQRVR